MLTVAAPVIFLLSLALAQATPAPAPPSSAAFNEGVRLHDSGKPADAIPFFKDAIAKGFQPINQAHFRLARSYAMAGQPGPAVAELEWLANAGFTNVAALAMPDLNALRALPGFHAAEKKINANARPCDADPNYRAFDFWIGEWDVQPTGPNRAPMGQGASSVIERQLGGCMIQENWLPPNKLGEGKSFNTYNASTKQWEQYYVDGRGGITLYKGVFRDDGNLYYEAEQFASANKIRMTFFNQGPNQVRQLGHISTDGGKTWNVTFDLTYVRKPAKTHTELN